MAKFKGKDIGEVYFGTADKDDIDGRAGDDVLFGRGGDDKIDGGDGNDFLDGGDGEDDLKGGDGNDTIHGGAGDDKIKAGDGDDFIDAGAGDDKVKGGNGDDIVAHSFGENAGDSDDYRGDDGIDTLALYLTEAEVTAMADEIATFRDFIEKETDAKKGEASNKKFTFDSFDLTVRGFENVEVFATFDDAFEIEEDSGATIFDLTANDLGSSGAVAFRLVPGSGPAAGTVVMDEATGQVSFDPDGAFEGLAAGEQTTVSFDYEVDYGNGRTNTATATITVTGTNDAPLITSNPEDATGAVIEAGVDAGAAVATGTLTSSDADSGATATWSGSSVGTYGSIVIDPETGDWTYTLDDSDPDTNALAANVPVTETFTMMVTDDKGATAEETVTIAVTGANDAPVAPPRDLGEIVESDDAITLQLLDGITDPEGDDVSVLRSSLRFETDDGSGVISKGKITDGSFDLDARNFDDLQVGESREVTVSYTVVDSNGAETPTSVTFTVIGTNDAPTVFTARTTASEDDATLDVNLLRAARDPDSDDLDVRNVTATSSDGRPVSIEVDEDTGVVTLTPQADFNDLGAGETARIAIDFVVDDNDGGQTPAQAIVTVNGANDAPVFVASTFEDIIEGDDTLTVEGSFVIDDPDASDTPLVDSSSPRPPIWSGGALDADQAAALTQLVELDPSVASGGAFDVSARLKLSGPALDFLSLGDTLTLTEDLKLTDGTETVTETITFTVRGTNDDPTLTAGLLELDEDETAATLDLTALGADVDSDDDGDSLTYAITGAPAEGTATLSGGILSFDPGSDFADLIRGETRDVTLQITATDRHGASAVNDVTVTVTGVNTPPQFIGPAVLPTGAVGNLAVDYEQDLSGLFFDSDGDPLIFTSGDLPTGFALSETGVLTRTGTGDITALDEQTFTVTVDDGRAGPITRELTINLALRNDFGDRTSDLGLITGSSLDDIVVVGDDASGVTTVSTGAGNDGISFGEFAGFLGTVTTQGGSGYDTMAFGALAGYSGVVVANGDGGADTLTFGFGAGFLFGQVTANGGDGADSLTFGSSAGTDSGRVTANGGNGDDAIEFGNLAGGSSGIVTANGGAGADTITFGLDAGKSFSGLVAANGDDGDDVITFGDNAGVQGRITVSGGDGTDTIAFGNNAGSEAEALAGITVDGDAGGDTITFGQNAGVDGRVIVNGGDGADSITFGADAGGENGEVVVNGGTGADAIMFGSGAENLTIDLGPADGAADSLTFEGLKGSVVIRNWAEAEDIVSVVDPSEWRGSIIGSDTVFTASGERRITFEGVTGVAFENILPGYTNTAPVFTGAASLPDAAVGNLADPYSQDLSALFTDADGDTLNFTASGLPAGVAVSSAGILTISNPAALGDTGTATVNVTARDTAGASASASLSFDYFALRNDYGFGFAEGFGTVETVTGTDFGDLISFQSLAGASGGQLTVDAGAGENTIEMGFVAGRDDGRVSVISGDDADTIRFENGTGDGGEVAVTSGGGADQIVFVSGANGEGTISVDAGSGTDTITLGNGMANLGGTIRVDGGSGADIIRFGENTAETPDDFSMLRSTVEVDGGDGADIISFGNFRSGFNQSSGDITVDGGGSSDTITFGDNAAIRGGRATVDGGSSADEIAFGNNAAGFGGFVSVFGGTNADTITFGDNAAQDGGEILVDGGSNSEDITFGDDAARDGGTVKVIAGTGNDTITFGRNAAESGGLIEVLGGGGADTFIFGDDVGGTDASDRGEINLFLGGSDNAVDTVRFGDGVFNVTIYEWELGTDAKVDVEDLLDWTLSSVGATRTFSNGDQSITFENVIGGSINDFLI